MSFNSNRALERSDSSRAFAGQVRLFLPLKRTRRSRVWLQCVLAALYLGIACIPLPLLAKEKKPKKDEKTQILWMPAPGVYATNVSLRLSLAKGSGTIRYTLDGSEPNEASPAFSNPLLVTN